MHHLKKCIGRMISAGFSMKDLSVILYFFAEIFLAFQWLTKSGTTFSRIFSFFRLF